MSRLRSRILISLAVGIVAVGLVVFVMFFSEHSDETTIENFHRGPIIFSLVWALIGVAIAFVAFVVLTLIAWIARRWPARSHEAEEGVRPLYSPNQAFGAAFIGGPLAAVSLLKANYLTLSNPAYARKTLIFGWAFFLAFLSVVLTLVTWGISFKGIGSGIGVATAVTAKSLVGSLQRTKQAISASDRYSFRSNWLVIGLGLFYLAASLVIIFAAGLMLALAGVHPPD